MQKSNDPITPNTTSSIVQQGNWKITLYNSKGSDETANYSGYTFTFNSNGSVSAVKSSSTVTGTWNSGTDDSLNKFYLSFGAVSPFDELNDDWHITEKTTVKISLEAISGGGGGELLNFEKN